MAAVTDLKHEPAKARRTLGIAGGAHFLHDGFTDAIYALLPIWEQAFGLTLTQVGLLKTVVSGVLSAFQLPVGFLSERFGPKGLLACGTIVAGGGYLLAGAAGGFVGLLLAMVVIGLGAGVQHPLSSALVSGAYRNGGRRSALGIYNFSGDLGKMVIPATVALGAGIIGWRESSMLLGAAGIVGGIVIWLALSRLSPRVDTVVPASADKAPTAKGWGFRDARGFGLLSSIGFLDTAVRYAFLPFLPFLLIDKGMDREGVGFALALVFAGGAAGKFACGMLADRIGIIRSVVLTEAVTGLGILVLLALPLTPALILLPAIGLALNGTSSVLYGTVSEFVAEDRQARAFSLFYTIGMASGAAAPIVFGMLGDGFGLETALACVAAMAFAVILICPILAPHVAGTER